MWTTISWTCYSWWAVRFQRTSISLPRSRSCSTESLMEGGSATVPKGLCAFFLPPLDEFGPFGSRTSSTDCRNGELACWNALLVVATIAVIKGPIIKYIITVTHVYHRIVWQQKELRAKGLAPNRAQILIILILGPTGLGSILSLTMIIHKIPSWRKTPYSTQCEQQSVQRIDLLTSW